MSTRLHANWKTYLHHNMSTVSYNARFMCIRRKTGERLDEPRLYPSFKFHTHKHYISRHCTDIVYMCTHDCIIVFYSKKNIFNNVFLTKDTNRI